MDLFSSTARYVDAFLAVCGAGSITAAAAALNRTQPAVTYQIKKLEEAVGAMLFERRARRLVLTREGRELRIVWQRHARELAGLHRQLVSGLAAPPVELRIAAVSGFGRYVLYPQLKPLLASPRHQVTLLFRSADEVFRLVDEGSVDCGAVYHTKTTNRLEFTPLYEEELVLIVPRAGSPSAASLRTLAAYSRLRFVTYEESEYVFGKWFQVNFRRQPRATTPACTFTELEEVVDAVASGVGVSIVPSDAAVAATGRLRIVRPTGRACVNQVFQVTRAGTTTAGISGVCPRRSSHCTARWRSTPARSGG